MRVARFMCETALLDKGPYVTVSYVEKGLRLCLRHYEKRVGIR